jgi:hypothetical protein
MDIHLGFQYQLGKYHPRNKYLSNEKDLSFTLCITFILTGPKIVPFQCLKLSPTNLAYT